MGLDFDKLRRRDLTGRAGQEAWEERRRRETEAVDRFLRAHPAQDGGLHGPAKRRKKPAKKAKAAPPQRRNPRARKSQYHRLDQIARRSRARTQATAVVPFGGEP